MAKRWTKGEVKAILARTRTFRAWFRTLPRRAIDLNRIMAYTAPSLREAAIIGEPVPAHTPCNSAGCLMGWMETYLYRRKMPGDVYQVLGLGFVTPGSEDFFERKLSMTMTDRAEALTRLDGRIAWLDAVMQGTYTLREWQ